MNFLDDNIDNDSEYIEDLEGKQEHLPKTIMISGMYQNWFLDYASYVILERAVPEIRDGLKPVQRRILHAMYELDDGRYNKVANIIGHTMKYHPHGDTSIGDALVQLGQKDLLIDMQGNWGNIYTGDRAAASRYIEARLSKFAHAILFNEKTTEWSLSYDGRNKEPYVLPVKFPLLLAQGVEGIAVGLASKILPHNFIELIDASIDYVNGKVTEIYPDFITGGSADFSKYNQGMRGGKIRIRAKISQLDKKTLVVTEIPFGTTTTGLMESIVAANEKGKIKIRKIEDNTAENVEILIHLTPGISPDQTIDALYLFTDCEISISPNACIIEGNKPKFLSVNEILAASTKNTIRLLTLELQIRLNELHDQWHYISLEKIFIEKKIYRDIEKCETWEAVIDAIDAGLKPHLKKLKKPITKDDIVKLTELKIKKISKFDINKAENQLLILEEEIKKTNYHLRHINEYTIDYFKNIKERFGKGKERKTEIKLFDNIEATRVVVANQKLYVNREDGFAGYGLKKDEYICDCSDLDDIIAFRADGTFIVSKISEKTFMGKDLIHIAVFNKNDERTIYNMIYTDGSKGPAMIKRFSVVGITRDKEYQLTKGTPDSKVIYFTVNPNGETETITVFLKPRPRLKKLNFDFDFSTLAVKGRSSIGNILTRFYIKKIVLKNEGTANYNQIEVFFDESTSRINFDKRGKLIGAFDTDDRLITFYRSGYYRTMSLDINSHFDDDLLIIEKFDADFVYSVVYFDAELDSFYLKRFQAELSDKKTSFISDNPNSKLIYILQDEFPRLELVFDPNRKKPKPNELILVDEFIGVKNHKAKGKRLASEPVYEINILEPFVPAEQEELPLAFNEDENVEEIIEEPEIPTEEDENTGQIKLSF